MIGPSRKLQRGPPAFWARRRSNVRRSRHRARISCSWATRFGCASTERTIGPGCRSWGGASLLEVVGARIGRRRVGSGVGSRRAARRPAPSHDRRATPSERLGHAFGGSVYPTRDAAAATRGAPRAPGPRSSPPSSRSSSRASGTPTSAPTRGPSPSPRRRSCCSPCSAGLGLRAGRLELLGFVVQPWVLTSIFVGNVVALVYRVVATVDAYRVATYLNRWDEGAGRLGPSRMRLSAALGRRPRAVCLVMGGAHVAVAYYDLQALDLVQGVFDDRAPPTATNPSRPRRPGRRPTRARRPSRRRHRFPPRSGRRVPTETLPPWDGKERLNVLLDRLGRRPRGSSNTDTLIVATVDPLTGQVAMFSLPRDTIDVPIPRRPGPRGLRTRGTARSTASSSRPDPARPLPGDGHDERLPRPQGHSSASCTGSTSSASSRSTSTASARSSTPSAA